MDKIGSEKVTPKPKVSKRTNKTKADYYYKCAFCPAEVDDDAKLKIHIESKHLEDLFKFPCQTCGFNAEGPRVLREHIAKVHGGKNGQTAQIPNLSKNLSKNGQTEQILKIEESWKSNEFENLPDKTSLGSQASNSPISKVEKEVKVEPKIKSEPEKDEISLKPKQPKVENKDVENEYVLDVIDTSKVKSELDLAVNEETTIDKIVNDDVSTKNTTKSKTEPKEETGLVNYLKDKITKVGQFFYRSTEAKTDPKVPEVNEEKGEEIKNEEKENIEIKNESSDDAPLVSKKGRKKEIKSDSDEAPLALKNKGRKKGSSVGNSAKQKNISEEIEPMEVDETISKNLSTESEGFPQKQIKKRRRSVFEITGEDSSNSMPEAPLKESKRPRREIKVPKKYAEGEALDSSSSEKEEDVIDILSDDNDDEDSEENVPLVKKKKSSPVTKKRSTPQPAKKKKSPQSKQKIADKKVKKFADDYAYDVLTDDTDEYKPKDNDVKELDTEDKDLDFELEEADSHADSDSSNPVERGPKRGPKMGPKRSSSGTVNKRGSTGASFKRHKSTSEENNFEEDFEPPVMEVRLKPIIPSLTKPSRKSSSESANDDDVVQQFVDEFEPPTMAVQPGPSKPKAKSDGSSSELEVIFDSEVTEQKTKNSTGLKKGSKKSKGPKSKQKKSMNLDGHYSSMSSHSQDDENQDNLVFKDASNCVKKEVRVTLEGQQCYRCDFKCTSAVYFKKHTC